MKLLGRAIAHTNIALIKYWGKRNEEKMLPSNSSLSLTLEAFYTDTTVTFTDETAQDLFFLNDCIQSTEKTIKITRFIDLFRIRSGIKLKAIVKSTNFVPTAAGLASSASGFAALAGAVNRATNLNLDNKELSMYARYGSGSATRSIYGGFVEWQMGTNESDSYSVFIDNANWDIAMVIVIVNKTEKNVSSREGMKRTVETSPFYQGWLDSTSVDLKNIKVAIKNHDFEQLGLITESNGLKMHATMLGATPPIVYFEPGSIIVMQMVKELRKKGIMCYFTMDAGPNVKILCRLSESNKIKAYLSQKFSNEQIIISRPGPGIKVF